MGIKTRPPAGEIPAPLPGVPLTHPTPAERRNGWTPETLTRYLARRQAEQAEFLLRKKKHINPKVENHYGFDPFRW